LFVLFTKKKCKDLILQKQQFKTKTILLKKNNIKHNIY